MKEAIAFIALIVITVVAGLFLYTKAVNAEIARMPTQCNHREYVILNGDTLQVIVETYETIHFRTTK